MTRRVKMADVAIVVVFVAGLVGIRPILARLNEARHLQATLIDTASQPEPTINPIMSPTRVLQAENRVRAAAEVVEALRQTAIRDGLLVESLHEAKSPAERVVAVEIMLSGDPAHVLRFAESIENRTPVIRFSNWCLANPAHGGSAKLSVTAASVWATKP